MLIHEFEELTGFRPTEQHYEVIEDYYNADDRDKDEFCKAFKENEGGLATRIQREANIRMYTLKADAYSETVRFESRIKDLEERLYKAEGWKEYEDPRAVTGMQYEALKDGCDPMTDADAKKLLHDWFGFDKSKVEICHAAPKEIISRDGRIKEVGTECRKPLYGATDFYYIRFTACGFTYEAVSEKLTVV